MSALHHPTTPAPTPTRPTRSARTEGPAAHGPHQAVLPEKVLLIALLGLVLSVLAVLVLTLVLGLHRPGPAQAPGPLPSPAPGPPVSARMAVGHEASFTARPPTVRARHLQEGTTR